MFVIAGVTGNTGGIVADTLLSQGKQVRVVVRDAQKGESWKKRGAEVAIASLEDTAALAKALAGASGAYFLLPPTRGGTDDVSVQQRKTADSIAAAVAQSGVGHVVLLSSIGAQHEGGTGPIKALHYTEKKLADATQAKLTFVRAAYFLDNWAAVAGAAKDGKLPTFIRPDLVMPMVSTRDIGRVAAQALAEGPPSSRIDVIELAGPRDWSPNDIAAAFGKVLGRTVAAEAAPLEAVVPVFTSFGFSKSGAELYQEMYAGIANGKVDWERKGVRFVRGSVDAETAVAAFTK